VKNVEGEGGKEFWEGDGGGVNPPPPPSLPP